MFGSPGAWLQDVAKFVRHIQQQTSWDWPKQVRTSCLTRKWPSHVSSPETGEKTGQPTSNTPTWSCTSKSLSSGILLFGTDWQSSIGKIMAASAEKRENYNVQRGFVDCPTVSGPVNAYQLAPKYEIDRQSNSKKTNLSCFGPAVALKHI